MDVFRRDDFLEVPGDEGSPGGGENIADKE